MTEIKLDKSTIDQATLDQLKEELKNELSKVLAESKVSEIFKKYGVSSANIFKLGLFINSSELETIYKLDSLNETFDNNTATTTTCQPKYCPDEEGNLIFCGCV